MAETQILHGPRLGKQGRLQVGCCAVIVDPDSGRVLLTRRADNGRWCLPGGAMESGESAAEACEREVWEETGLRVRAIRLIGVYSDPDQLVVYPSGDKVHFVILSFEAQVLSGEPGLSDETTEVGYFTLPEIAGLPMHGNHQQRAQDAFEPQAGALIK